MRFSCTFETPNYGRSISDQAWETIEPEHIRIWKSALSALKHRKLTIRNCIVDIDVDWTPILETHKKHYDVMRRFSASTKRGDKAALILNEFPSDSTKVPLVAEVTDSDAKTTEQRQVNSARNAIESYLHDCFLILNICAPGCCDFHRAGILTNGPITEISLSNVHFEIALLGSFQRDWPSIEILPLAKVVRWFDSIRIGTTQLPNNPMEKALFALLHIARLDIDPMIVIWIFYAFESLLQTKVGENFASIIHRLILLLELDENESKILRSKFRALYDIRSAIVHGGFEVAHPMHNEILDKRVDQNYERVSNAAEYGLTTLVAAMQKTIIRGWKYPTFIDTMNGVPIS